MRRLAFAILTVVAALACIQGFRLFGAADGPSTETGRRQAAAPHAELPIDEERVISFAVDAPSVADLTDADRVEQYRDWLLIAAIGALDNDPVALRSTLYDLPAIRRGYFRPIANLEFGPLRSRLVGGGTVIALLPADANPAQRWDGLAHIVDEQ